MKDTFYFSHDYNARSDEKIKRLIRKHGMTGYGVYWSIIEDLYNNANALRIDYDGIAYDLRVDTDMVESIINDFNLFCKDGVEFGSESVQKRLDARDEKSEKARESARKRWSNANAMQTHSDSNAIKERKGKEIKGKNKDIPAWETFHAYALTKKRNIDESHLRLKYDSWVENGWQDGNGKQIKNWKSKLLNTIPHLKVTTVNKVAL